MFRGMFTGMMMTVAGAFAADSMADANARPIVNWDVAIVKSIDVARNSVRRHVTRLMDRAPGLFHGDRTRTLAWKQG